MTKRDANTILCLDLSLSCAGYAKFSKDGKLLDKGRIIPEPELDNCLKIQYIADTIEKLYSGVNELVIEDIFLNPRFPNVHMLKELARLSGAVIYTWVTKKFKIPKFYMAVSARKLAGVNSKSHKAEIQVFILEKYKFAKKPQIDEYKKLIAEYEPMRKGAKSKWKYRMDKLSKQIDEDTNIGEDVADAILLGVAYKQENNGLF